MTVKEKDQVDFRKGNWKCPELMLCAVEKETPFPPKVFGGLHFMHCEMEGWEHSRQVRHSVRVGVSTAAQISLLW